MSFLYPQFLFALFALAVPLIIHLFNFRRYKKIFFTNVRFLTDIQKESKSKNKLRHLLLLLMRLLALACIIIAFAQPFFPQKKSLVTPGKNFVAIYVDNSFSMSNVGSQGELLQQAKTKAEEIAEAYRESDGFLLVTNDFELKHQRWINKPEFIQQLNEVAISPASRMISEVNARIKENFRKADADNKFVYLVSDFQKNISDLNNLEKDTSLIASAIPLQAAAQNNIYIDSVWFEGAIWQLNQSNTISARIVNASAAEVEEATLTLHINNKQKAIANFNIAANGQTDVQVPFTITEEGFNKAQLAINDFPVTFDDNYFFSFRVNRFVSVLAINGDKPNPFISKAYSAENAFRFQEAPIGNVDYSSLNQQNFVILNEPANISSGLAAALKEYVSKGGNLLFIPAQKDGDLGSINRFLSLFESGNITGINNISAGVSQFDVNNPFFYNIFEDAPKNISMPEVRKYYNITNIARSRKDILLQLSNGSTLLSVTPLEKGNLFVSAIPFSAEWSTFVNHALFLPVLYKMALYRPQTEKISNDIGKDNYLLVPVTGDVKEQAFRLKKEEYEVIPPQRMLDGNLNLYVEGLIKDAGHYSLNLSDKTSADLKNAQQVYSFNYDRKESEMKFLTPAEITEAGGVQMRILDAAKASLTTEIKNIQKGSVLWKWFILAALLFLAAETVLIRLWK